MVIANVQFSLLWRSFKDFSYCSYVAPYCNTARAANIVVIGSKGEFKRRHLLINLYGIAGWGNFDAVLA